MSSQTYRLVMRAGPAPGKVFDLQAEDLSIGRDISNHIVINDAEVSRRHARLRLQAGSYIIEDLGSTNGTFVNGQRLIGPHALRHGETVQLGGRVALDFEAVGFDAEATLVSGSARPAEPPIPETVRVPYSEQPAEKEPSTYPVYEVPAQPQEVPPSPGEAPYEVPYAPPEYAPAEEKSKKTWLYAALGCLVVLLCACVGGAFAFDALNLYCTEPFTAVTEALGFVCP